MIKIEIDRKNIEGILNKVSAEIKSSLKSIEFSLSSNNKPRFKERLYKRVKKPIIDQYGTKCFYCERFRATGELHIEHYRPKGGLYNNNKHYGYWWLAYKASNLLLACSNCNRKKSTKFPLINEKYRVYEPNGDLSKEEPLLIDPISEDPGRHFYYDFSDEVAPLMIGKTDKGRKTIGCLGLNNIELAMERKKDLYFLESCYQLLNSNLQPQIYETIRNMVKNFVTRDKPFLGMKKAYLRDRNFVH